jgi:O-antigen/teichoic acid export membrane protein
MNNISQKKIAFDSSVEMKESSASILSNTRSLMIAQIFTWASSFVLMMFLPRYLGAEAYGRLYFAISITMLAELIINLGLSSYFVKEVSRDKLKANLFLMNAASLRFIAWLIVMGCIFIYVISTGKLSEETNSESSETIIMLFILGIGTLLTSFSDLAYRIFQSFERLSFRSIAIAIERISLAVISVPLLIAGYGPVTISIVMALSYLFSLIISVYFLPRLINIKFEIQPSTWISLSKGALPFLISTIFAFIYFRIDVVMLSAMTNDEVVGWYGAPYKLFDTLMFFPLILQFAVFPVFARLWKESFDNFVQTAKKVFNISIIVSVLFSFILFTLANPITNFLFGLKGFENSVIILQGLALCIPLIYSNFVISNVNIAADKQKQLSYISIIAALINIGLNFLMIPYFQNENGNGAIGAMLATLITEAAVLAMSVYLLPAGCFSKENLVVVFKAAYAGIFAGFITMYLEDILNAWYLCAFIGTVVYFGILTVSNVITKRELNMVLSFFPQRWINNLSRFLGL